MSSDDLKEKRKRRRHIKAKRQISSSSEDLCLKEQRKCITDKSK